MKPKESLSEKKYNYEFVTNKRVHRIFYSKVKSHSNKDNNLLLYKCYAGSGPTGPLVA